MEAVDFVAAPLVQRGGGRGDRRGGDRRRGDRPRKEPQVSNPSLTPSYLDHLNTSFRCLLEHSL